MAGASIMELLGETIVLRPAAKDSSIVIDVSCR